MWKRLGYAWVHLNFFESDVVVNYSINYNNLTGAVTPVKLSSGTYTSCCCKTSVNFQYFRRNGARELCKNFGTLTGYLWMNFSPGEVFSIVVHSGIFHTHPGGFHMYAGDRKISKTNHWSSSMHRLTETMGMECKKENCLGESFFTKQLFYSRK